MFSIAAVAVLPAAVAAASSAPAPHHHHHYHPHDPGCRTRACDERVDRWWAAHHAEGVSEGEEVGASWYYDEGSTACGYHAEPGVANKTLPCGTRVRICSARCATLTVDDRGPYVEGRVFDLSVQAREAVAYPGDPAGVRWSFAS